MNQIFARLRTTEPLTKLHPGDAPSAPSEKPMPEEEATAEPARRALDQATAQVDTLRDSARSFTFMAHYSLTCLSIMACGFRRAAFRLKGKQKLICPYCVIIVKMDNPNINCGEGWIRNNDHKIMSLNHQSVIFNISF